MSNEKKINKGVIKMATCPRCGGKGTIKCPGCGGKGQGYGIIHGTWKCSRCNGSGEIQCPNCGGKGKV